MKQVYLNTVVSVAAGVLATALLTGCANLGWGRGEAVTERQVAGALGLHAALDSSFDPDALADVPAPENVRPCCAFGVDLAPTVAGREVGVYTLENVTEPDAIGRHQYDNGWLSFSADLADLISIERDGQIYTCRGGFVDTAHVRDYADMTLYLAHKLVRTLPGPSQVHVVGDGATKTVVVDAIPPEIIAARGRWPVAVQLAQWIAFRFSIWHEVATWYGYESTRGFSEQISAFSPEDMYSNALGIKIAGGILNSRTVGSRAEWNQLMDEWMQLSFAQLGAVDLETGGG